MYGYGVEVANYNDFHRCMAAIRKWMAAVPADADTMAAYDHWERLYVEVMGNDYNRFEA